MKTLEIDGKIIHIYDDGSIRIPHEGVQLCLDLMDIEQLYSESKNALNRGGPDQGPKMPQ
ncbi:MAG: hypothetical protein WBM78_00575 [Desulfobacterales bacterium]